MNKREIKNIFGWLNEITVQKSPINSFSDKSWDNWNSYMVHRFLSMNRYYIDIVNYVQKMNPQSKKLHNDKSMDLTGEKQPPAKPLKIKDTKEVIK